MKSPSLILPFEKKISMHLKHHLLHSFTHQKSLSAVLRQVRTFKVMCEKQMGERKSDKFDSGQYVQKFE